MPRPPFDLDGPWVLETALTPLDPLDDFEPRTFEFESVAAGLTPCLCPHCGSESSYVTVLAPETVVCPQCGGGVPIVPATPSP